MLDAMAVCVRACRDVASSISVSVESDRDGPAAPREGLGQGREPEVDRRSPDRASRVRGNAFAVARDRHPGPEQDYRRVDRDDAPAHRDSRGRAAGQGVAGRADGDLSLIHISEPTRQAEISYA